MQEDLNQHISNMVKDIFSHDNPFPVNRRCSMTESLLCLHASCITVCRKQLTKQMARFDQSGTFPILKCACEKRAPMPYAHLVNFH